MASLCLLTRLGLLALQRLDRLVVLFDCRSKLRCFLAQACLQFGAPLIFCFNRSRSLFSPGSLVILVFRLQLTLCLGVLCLPCCTILLPTEASKRQVIASGLDQGLVSLGSLSSLLKLSHHSFVCHPGCLLALCSLVCLRLCSVQIDQRTRRLYVGGDS